MVKKISERNNEVKLLYTTSKFVIKAKVMKTVHSGDKNKQIKTNETK